MTAKQFLCEYRDLDKEIDSMVSELTQLRHRAESIGGSLGGSNNGEKHVRQTGAAKFEGAIDKMIVLDEKINVKINVLIDKREQIEKVLNDIEDTVLRTLLRNRYINGYNFERVAVEMNFCWRWVLSLHGKALIEVEKRINTAC